MPATQTAAITPIAHGSLLLKPTHAKDEVLIKIEGAGLNPMDWKMHDFNAMFPSYPYVFGGDIAGTVEERK
ncbi:hypothetical protein BT69DRAFT_1234735 [Atractiella rhizophila]|nr:hypothetical protein BT69DRAFT_1234735 [Atractiella rhizophila]